MNLICRLRLFTYQVLEFIYQVLDKYAEDVLNIEYDKIDDFTDEARNYETPNITQNVSDEIDSTTDKLAMGEITIKINKKDKYNIERNNNNK
jgi:hypothetical protein